MCSCRSQKLNTTLARLASHSRRSVENSQFARSVKMGNNTLKADSVNKMCSVRMSFQGSAKELIRKLFMTTPNPMNVFGRRQSPRTPESPVTPDHIDKELIIYAAPENQHLSMQTVRMKNEPH
jgi:hypothetical protein